MCCMSGDETQMIGDYKFDLSIKQCQQTCLATSGCDAIYTDAPDSAGTCQLFPATACVPPSGKNPNYPTGKIYVLQASTGGGTSESSPPPSPSPKAPLPPFTVGTVKPGAR